MFKSLKSKIVIPSIGAVTLLVLFIIVYTAINVNGLADGFKEDRLATAAHTARAYMDSLRERCRLATYALSENQAVVELVRNWNNGINAAQSRQ